jgi:hypothetical protein
MKKFYYTLLILVSVIAASCSDDDVTPQLKDTTLAFLPAADDKYPSTALFVRGYSNSRQGLG